MTHDNFTILLSNLDACNSAKEWVATRRDLRAAWAECSAEWLLWLAYSLRVDKKLIVLAACGCARAAIRYFPFVASAPILAIETAEAWTRGEATTLESRVAVDAVRASSYPEGFSSAARSAYYAAYSPTCSLYASYAGAHAEAALALADGARPQECADVVRGLIPYELLEAAAEHSEFAKG